MFPNKLHQQDVITKSLRLCKQKFQKTKIVKTNPFYTKYMHIAGVNKSFVIQQFRRFPTSKDKKKCLQIGHNLSLQSVCWRVSNLNQRNRREGLFLVGFRRYVEIFKEGCVMFLVPTEDVSCQIVLLLAAVVAVRAQEVGWFSTVTIPVLPHVVAPLVLFTAVGTPVRGTCTLYTHKIT